MQRGHCSLWQVGPRLSVGHRVEGGSGVEGGVGRSLASLTLSPSAGSCHLPRTLRSPAYDLHQGGSRAGRRQGSRTFQGRCFCKPHIELPRAKHPILLFSSNIHGGPLTHLLSASLTTHVFSAFLPCGLPTDSDRPIPLGEQRAVSSRGNGGNRSCGWRDPGEARTRW